MLCERYEPRYYRIYSRNSRTFFNQNFVPKFKVRDLCEEMFLRK